MAAVDSEFLEEIRDLEEELWRADTRFNPKRMDELFAKDFYEIGRSGKVWSRNELLNMSRREFSAQLPLPGFTVRVLAEDTIQTTYRSAVTYGPQTEWAQRSSIWSKSSGKWQIRFHQGTTCNDNV